MTSPWDPPFQQILEREPALQVCLERRYELSAFRRVQHLAQTDGRERWAAHQVWANLLISYLPDGTLPEPMREQVRCFFGDAQTPSRASYVRQLVLSCAAFPKGQPAHAAQQMEYLDALLSRAPSQAVLARAPNRPEVEASLRQIGEGVGREFTDLRARLGTMLLQAAIGGPLNVSRLDVLSLSPGYLTPPLSQLAAWLQRHQALTSLGFDFTAMNLPGGAEEAPAQVPHPPTHPRLAHLQTFSIATPDQMAWLVAYVDRNPQIRGLSLHFHVADADWARMDGPAARDWGFVAGLRGLEAFRLVGYRFADRDEVRALATILGQKALHHLALMHLSIQRAPEGPAPRPTQYVPALPTLLPAVSETGLLETLTSLHVAGRPAHLALLRGAGRLPLCWGRVRELVLEYQSAGPASELLPWHHLRFLASFPAVRTLSVARTPLGPTFTTRVNSDAAQFALPADEILPLAWLPLFAAQLPALRGLSITLDWSPSSLSQLGPVLAHGAFGALTQLRIRNAPTELQQGSRLDLHPMLSQPGGHRLSRFYHHLASEASRQGIQLRYLRIGDAPPVRTTAGTAPFSQLHSRFYQSRAGRILDRQPSETFSAESHYPFAWALRK